MMKPTIAGHSWPGFMLAVLLPIGAGAVDRYSAGTGNWSSPATWVGGVVPGAADDVYIQGGTTVTVDTTTARANGVLIYSGGILQFSTVSSGTLTITKGNVWVGTSARMTMGTQAAPIPANVNATLILPVLSGSEWYGLQIDDNGSFQSHGSAKSPVAVALGGNIPAGATSLQVPTAQSSGWRIGDRVIVAEAPQDNTLLPFLNRTEERILTGLSVSGATTTVSWSGGLAYAHYADLSVRVANLTKNVLIRSSGTNIGANTSFVMNTSDRPDGFLVAQTEFAHLGRTDMFSWTGVNVIDGRYATISSCTIRNGNQFFAVDADDLILSNSVLHANEGGVYIDSDCDRVRILNNDIAASMGGPGFNVQPLVVGAVFRGNHVYSTDSEGGTIRADSSLFDSNRFHSNKEHGIRILGDRNAVVNNIVRSNGLVGLYLSGAAPLVTGNRILFNANWGAHLELNGGTFVGNESMGNGWTGFSFGGSAPSGSFLFAKGITRLNGGAGLSLSGPMNMDIVESSFGYDASGADQPDSTGEPEFYFDDPVSVNLRGCRVNPAGQGIGRHEDMRLLSYNQDFATGTVRVVEGGTLASGESLVLDHAQPTWRASVTTPVLMSGVGHAAAASAPSDANAVTQAVTIRCLDGAANQWVVEGTSGGVLHGPFTGSLLGQSIAGQFTLSFTPGPSPVTDDRVSFMLLASSRDGGVQKRLRFADADPLVAAPGATLDFRGQPGGTAMVVDAIAAPAPQSGTSPFALISSGTLNLADVSMQGMDRMGLRLSGSGGVSMSTVTLDNVQSGGAKRAAITARDLTSGATFYNVVFNDSFSSLPLNVDVQGSDAGLRLYFASFGGVRSGDANDNDPNQKILWADALGPNAPGAFSAVPGGNTGEVALSWTAPSDREDVPAGTTSTLKAGSFRIFHSTVQAARDAATAGQAQVAVLGVTSAPGALFSRTEAGLPLGATCYFRLWASDEFGNPSPSVTDAQSSAARATPVSPSNFSASAAGADVTLTWTQPTVPPAAYLGLYELRTSSVSATGPWTVVMVSSSAVSHLHGGLPLETTYFYELRTVDAGGGSGGTSSPASASARTGDIVPAQALPSAGPTALGVSLTPPLTVGFTKPMQPVTVAGAVSLTRVRDNLGDAVDEPVSISVSSNAAGDLYTLAGPPLAGNSAYVLRVSTGAVDAQGKPLPSAAALSFTTLLDHAVRNVFLDPAGIRADIPANVLAADGYLMAAAAPSAAAAAAAEKMVGNTGDAWRRPLPGSVQDVRAYDAFGAPQPSSFSSPVEISLPYPDLDGDGVVDGSWPPVKAKTLSVYWLDEGKAIWHRLPNSSVDQASRRVSAPAYHFSVFALAGQADLDASAAHAFPSPFVEGQGAAAVTFTGLGQIATVSVYTSTGRLVREGLVPALGASTVDWDMRNDDGEPVAAGLYLYRIKSGSSSVTGKLVVVR